MKRRSLTFLRAILSGVAPLAAVLAAPLAAQQPLTGRVVAWGENFYGQCNVPSDLSGVVAVAAGGAHSIALRGDGTVVAWGYDGNGQSAPPVGLSGVVAIAAGAYHSVALDRDGTVVAWGNNDNGQTDVPVGLSAVIAVAAGGNNTVALKEDGSVSAWGNNNGGQTNVPAGLSGVVAIAAGTEHTLALKEDGTVVAWGWDGNGQTEILAGLSGVVAIAAGGAHSIALKSDGSVSAWGWNGYGQTDVPVGLSGVVAVAAGYAHTVALKGDGSVVAWGIDASGETEIPAFPGDILALSAGGRQDWTMIGGHSLAVVKESPPPSLSLDPMRHDPPAAGGAFDFEVSASDDWIWSLGGGDGWVTTSEATEQSGDQTFSYSVSPNQDVSPRSATIVFSSGDLHATHSIQQAGANPLPPVVTLRGSRTIRTTRTRVTLRGIASDPNGDLAWVRFRDTRPKAARWRSVRGLKSWSAVAVLGPKRANTMRVQAGDATGLRSRVASVRVLRRR